MAASFFNFVSRLEMPGNDSNTELQTELNILLQSVQSDSNTEQDRLNYGNVLLECYVLISYPSLSYHRLSLVNILILHS